MQFVILDGEFDLHFFAQLFAAGFADGQQCGKYFWTAVLQRGAAVVFGQVDRAFDITQSIAALALTQIATGDLRHPRGAVDVLDDTRSADHLAHAQCHGLHDQPQPCVGGRAFGLAQQARGGAVPCTRHGAQDFAQLHLDALRERLVGLELIGFEHMGEGFFIGVCGDIKRLGVQPRDMHGKRAQEFEVECGGRRCAY